MALHEITKSLFVADAGTADVRYNTYVTSVTPTSFGIFAQTWESSVIYGMDAIWMACGQV